jgi:endonuclease/exonuclease/phosphatase family metal-dependent hydrolase
MRVVSWNLWWRFGGRWRERQARIISMLEGLQPDVAGLQEVWGGEGTSQAEVLADRLGMHFAFAAPSLPPLPVPSESPDQNGIEVGVAVLSRWPIMQLQQQRLPSVNRARPVALMATIDHPQAPLHVISTCVEWEPDFAEDHLPPNQGIGGIASQRSA